MLWAMRASFAVAAACLVLFALVPAQAQQPGPTAKVLWAHGAAPDSGDTLWSNFDKEDPDATDTANGPGYNCSLGTVPVLGDAVCAEAGDPGDPVEEDIDHTFTLAMDPALSVPLQFTGTTVGVNLFFGASSGTGSGNAVVRLLAGETVVAESGDIPFSYDQGYAPATGEATVKVQSVEAGAALVWEIHATGRATGFFLGIHDDNGKSNLVLPLGSDAAVEALTGDSVDIERTFNDTTNQTMRFTWPSPSKPLTIAFTSTGNGTASLNITGNGTSVQHTQTDGQGTGTTGTTVTGNGTWNITISLTAFNGTVRLTIQDAGTTTGSGTATGTGGTSRSSSTSRTSEASTGNTTEEGKDTPGPVLPLTLATLGLAVLARRRRLL